MKNSYNPRKNTKNTGKKYGEPMKTRSKSKSKLQKNKQTKEIKKLKDKLNECIQSKQTYEQLLAQTEIKIRDISQMIKAEQRAMYKKKRESQKMDVENENVQDNSSTLILNQIILPIIAILESQPINKQKFNQIKCQLQKIQQQLNKLSIKSEKYQEIIDILSSELQTSEEYIEKLEEERNQLINYIEEDKQDATAEEQ